LQQLDAVVVARLFASFNPYRVFKFVATEVAIKTGSTTIKFQSLSGFQVRCNGASCDIAVTVSEVSIPIGFSSSLQQEGTFTATPASTSFQSLSGFQVRCNSSCHDFRNRHDTRFQSLSGFQVRCNIGSIAAAGSRENGFNPYRVFKFVATQKIRNRQYVKPKSFNPYRVFKFVATLWMEAL